RLSFPLPFLWLYQIHRLARNANYSGPLQCLTTTSGTFFSSSSPTSPTYRSGFPLSLFTSSFCLCILKKKERRDIRHATKAHIAFFLSLVLAFKTSLLGGHL
ncbi:hypothetical protein CABS01_02430, partial [Colletotrichum abscissum]|uniref:uncharacterized protein n=1 Tax=Colletotrichum abscissum TaxID=1671311 RepID=UPI0027D62899